MKSLELSNIEKNYGAYHAIKGVSFTVEPGEFIVMVGPSGCGKSTLLRSIAGLEAITSGTISINGKNITNVEPADRGVAMVFQNYALYPHMTVRENMGFALKIAGRHKAEIASAVTRAAKILRIEDHLDKKPKQLSGGQKQRVAIGRAITRSPDVFLFDEPLSNLDAALRSQMRIELGRLHAELKATMVYVTHDQTEAMTMASRIVVLNDGRIEQMGTPLDLYNAPSNKFVAGFLGSPRMNFFSAKVMAVSGTEATLRVGEGTTAITIQCPADWQPSVGESLDLGIRPERIKLGKAGPFSFSGHVTVIESLGRETLLYADMAGIRTEDSESQEGLFSIQCAAQVDSKIGDPITLSFDQDDLFVFSKDGTTRIQSAVVAHA